MSIDIDTYKSFDIPFKVYRAMYIILFANGLLFYFFEEIIFNGHGGFLMENFYFFPILLSGLMMFLRWVFYDE